MEDISLASGKQPPKGRVKRKSISKKTRFEVFKRDSFKCQYCGASAPDVLLHVDHIIPVSRGGACDVVNLVTSCAPCNGGKSNRPLSDTSVVAKQKAAIDTLQERRNQLEQLVRWRDQLPENVDLDVATRQYEKFRPGFTLSELGKGRMLKLIRQFGAEAVILAIADVPAGIDEDSFWGVLFIKSHTEEVQALYKIRAYAAKRTDMDQRKKAEALRAMKSVLARGGTIEDIWAATSSHFDARSGFYDWLNILEAINGAD